MKQVLQVFWQFFSLGWVSFGGPAAHIGYFHRHFVEKQQWLDQASYARMLSLSQLLPGPGSSQLGFAIGLQRAGLAGGIAAFIGFTLPSFILLYLFAVFSLSVAESPWLMGLIHGLKLLAVVVVADACLSMAGNFCKQRWSQAIAVVTAVILLLFPSLTVQMLVLLGAAVLGLAKAPPAEASQPDSQQSLKPKLLPLLLFAGLFFGLPLLAKTSAWAELSAGFYQAGSLVFGGGHVVLPLLQQTVGEAMTAERFLSAYASAQAVPGPMFTIATFMGVDLAPDAPLLGALVATLAVFAPGFLLLLAFYHSWEALSSKPRVAAAVWGGNAAVVGLLVAALYQPVFQSAVNSSLDMALVLLGFFLLRSVKLPIVALVAGFAAVGIVLSLTMGIS